MWRFEMTRNLTLAMDEDMLAQLRVYAAQHKTTVNALFRKHAEDILGTSDNRKAARERMLELSRQSEAYDNAHPNRFSDAQPGFSREETYSGRRFEWPRKN
jgi:plasmid stability protein